MAICKEISAGGGYISVIGRGTLRELGRYLPESIKGRRVAVFADRAVDSVYGETLEESFRSCGFEVFRYTFEGGENSKTLETVADFLDFMSAHRLTRGDAVAALGGGVAGDMGGFAASIYLRGIKVIQFPTTLLAAVDSSIGGKTGVNTSFGKNLTGTFWQPSAVIYDADTFDTLSPDQIMEGYAEAIKTAAIRDAALFERLEHIENISDISGSIEEIVSECVRIKGDVVEADEREGGLRRILNFGHTMAHAIEKCSGYTVSHGKAVAMGMLMITKASEARGITEAGTYTRLKSIISANGYREEPDIPVKDLCEAALADKKTTADSISLVYLKRIGEAGIYDVKLNELYDFMNTSDSI